MGMADCVLRSTWGGMVDNCGGRCKSGERSNDPSCGSNGNNIGREIVRKITYSACLCAEACENHDQCVGWTFVPYGVFPSMGMADCVLRSTWGGMVDNCGGRCKSGERSNGKWSSPTPVRGQISCSTNSFHGDPYPYVPKICECSSLEWEFLGSGACVSKENHIYTRQVLVAGQYGFSSGKESCKQLCAKYPGCVGINYVNVHDHCHINLGDGATIAGLGWNIHTGSGTGPIHHTVWMGTWECHRIVNNF